MVSRLDTQTNIRLPAELKRSLVDAAAENRRSLSAEIEARLADSFSEGSRAGNHEQLQRVVDQLMVTLKMERESQATFLYHVLGMFSQALRALDEAILLAQYKNATADDMQRLRAEFNNARGAHDAFRALSAKGGQSPT